MWLRECKNEKKKFTYTGFSIIQTKDYILLDQSHYTQNSIDIPIIPTDRAKDKKADLSSEELSLLRKMTGALNWVVRATRPDLSFQMIELSTKFKKGSADDLVRASKALTNIKGNKAEINFPLLVL